jgi:hypothetical protein
VSVGRRLDDPQGHSGAGCDEEHSYDVVTVITSWLVISAELLIALPGTLLPVLSIVLLVVGTAVAQ